MIFEECREAIRFISAATSWSDMVNSGSVSTTGSYELNVKSPYFSLIIDLSFPLFHPVFLPLPVFCRDHPSPCARAPFDGRDTHIQCRCTCTSEDE